MIFSKKSQIILGEWISDFEDSPIASINELENLLPLKKARNGEDCKMVIISEIVSLAVSNLKVQVLKTEAQLILKDIRLYYEIEIKEQLITLTKKTDQ